MRVTTESGAVYQFDGRTVTRIAADGDTAKRSDGKPMSFTFWGTPKLGHRMHLFFDRDEFNAAEEKDFEMPMRTTTPVVSIQYTEE